MTQLQLQQPPHSVNHSNCRGTDPSGIDPSSSSKQQQPQLHKQQQQQPTVQVQQQQQRPYDTLGPPSNPIDFPRPQLIRGRRDTVVCYNRTTEEHEVLHNVLFREFPTTNTTGGISSGGTTCPRRQRQQQRQTQPQYPSSNHPSANPQQQQSNGIRNNNCSSSSSKNNSRRHNHNRKSTSSNTITKAYWPIPYKTKIQTIMGHVEYVTICVFFSLWLYVCVRYMILIWFYNALSLSMVHFVRFIIFGSTKFIRTAMNAFFSHATLWNFALIFFDYGRPLCMTLFIPRRICRVLKRCTRRREDGEDDNDSSSCSSNDEDYEEEDEEIVFEWTEQQVAVKVNYMDRMDRLRDQHAENPLQEIAAMQLLGSNPIHVLGAMDVLFDGQNLNVVMRYCNSGDLFQLLQDRQNSMLESTATQMLVEPTLPPPPGLSEGETRYWFRQVMKGVQYLHACGICHRDLSPENIMIDRDEGLIIDMGMCLRVPYIDPKNINGRTDIVQAKSGLGTTCNSTTITRCLINPQGACGKLPYMCPEILVSRHPFDGEAADVWTCGTILFCMITGNRSYQRPHISDPQFYWMTQGLRQLLSDWNVMVSEEGIALLQGMLEIDPRKRFTLEEVCHHVWFQYPDEPPPTTTIAGTTKTTATSTRMEIETTK
jgi:Protein kinase domain